MNYISKEEIPNAIFNMGLNLHMIVSGRENKILFYEACIINIDTFEKKYETKNSTLGASYQLGLCTIMSKHFANIPFRAHGLEYLLDHDFVRSEYGIAYPIKSKVMDYVAGSRFEHMENLFPEVYEQKTNPGTYWFFNNEQRKTALLNAIKTLKGDK